jgi:RHS repeat-associated protein
VRWTDYFAYGAIRDEWSIGQTRDNYGYTGKELDTETGLNDFGARHFDALVGIWNTQDPLWRKFPSLSPYIYGANNPLKFIDPNGKEPIPFWQARKAWQWYETPFGTYDQNSFHQAALYSTQNLKADAYQSIYQRNAYYGWVDQQVSQHSRWFGAAAAVTGIRAVGTADNPLSQVFVFNHTARHFLQSGNKYLFSFNMANAKSIMNTGGLTGTFMDAAGQSVTFDGLQGQALDNAMVQFEQTQIESFIQQYQKDNPNADMNGVFDQINGSFANLSLITDSAIKYSLNKNFKDTKFDFRNYEHRVLMGQGMVEYLYQNSNSESK